MSNNIIRTKERIKQTGEVFTPTPLVNELLDKLPPEVFMNPTKTFCDPACGDGEFLIEVLKRKLDNGHNLSEASASIYGVDLMPDNIKACKSRLRKILMDYMGMGGRGRKLNGGVNDNINNNIVCADALSWDFINWLPSKIERQVELTDELLEF